MVLTGTMHLAATTSAAACKAVALHAASAGAPASHLSLAIRAIACIFCLACTLGSVSRLHQRRIRFSKPLGRPLRVLFIHRDLPFHGGVPRCLLYLARATDPNRVKLYIGSLIAPSPQMQKAFGEMGITTCMLGDGAYIAPAIRLRRVLSRDQIDIVVGTSFKAYVVAKLASIGLYAVPIFWIHAIFGAIEGRIRHRLFRIIGRHDPLLFVSEAVRLAHQPAGHEGPRAVVHNGVEDYLHDPEYTPYDRGRRAEFGITEDAIVIGTTAEFILWKDQPTLIAAMELLSNRGLRNIQLILIGTGQTEPQIRRMAAKTSAADRILFMGARTDARKILGLVDIFAHASLGEGLGLAVVEAMLAARPVVVARKGAVVEYVEDGVTGLFFEPQNAVHLADQIELLVRDPQLGQRLGQAGRQRALEMFDLDRFASRISQFVEQTSGLMFDEPPAPAEASPDLHRATA